MYCQWMSTQSIKTFKVNITGKVCKLGDIQSSDAGLTNFEIILIGIGFNTTSVNHKHITFMS